MSWVVKNELPKKRITVDEFYAMPFPEETRVELIDGEIIDMPTIGIPHAAIVNWLTRQLVVAVGDSAIVQCQGPMRLSNWDEPVPDFALFKYRPDMYHRSRPLVEDTLLAVEVSDSSIRFDQRTKAPLYARRGVQELWIFNLPKQQVHFYRSPAEEGYLDVSSTSTPGVTPLPSLDGKTVDLTGLLTLW